MVGSDLESSKAAVELAKTHDSVYAAVGIHPHEADKFDSEEQGVRDLFGEEKVVAVGEIGLDYCRSRTDRELQRRAFRHQLEWAARRHMPVSVHNRGADEEVLRDLEDIPVTPILHCFSSSGDYAAHAVRLGAYFSFAGNLTFPRAETLRVVARDVPAERLLLETDSPVLAPQPWRGKRNEPGHIRATLDVLSDVRGLPREALEQQLTNNAARVLGWGA